MEANAVRWEIRQGGLAEYNAVSTLVTAVPGWIGDVASLLAKDQRPGRGQLESVTPPI